MAECYLCTKDAGSQYCDHCNEPICIDHALWGKNHARCPLENKDFYDRLIGFCVYLREYSEHNHITKKAEIVKCVTDAIINSI